jgi:hypothetical protein
MRVVVHEYAQDGRAVIESTDDGAKLLAAWEGRLNYDARICGYIEVVCENTDNGIERLLDSLHWLTEEIKKRKLQPAGATANGGA